MINCYMEVVLVEKDLARYKFIFEEILKMTDDGFIVVDREGVITDINDQYSKFLGTTKKEAVGQPIANIISNTKMNDIMNKKYREEGVVHKFQDGDAEEEFMIVSRSYVNDESGETIAGVAQVKFRLETLDVAKKLMSQYNELQFYKEEYEKDGSNRYSFKRMIGKDDNFIKQKKNAMRSAKTDFPVLITGETGTGKEVFAQSIHKQSKRRDKPMVSINCAAIPSELLESELFGYEEGAFTGAKKGGKKGKFELSDGGTIFLDEIGDMPLEMQAKILRVLQEKEVERVGGMQPIPIDVRVISATRRDLSKMIEEGKFREDLYYRLNVINLHMIPLRERRMDIKIFVEYFLDELNTEYKSLVTISRDTMKVLENYDWPGNIRELENVIKSAYASSTDTIIDTQDLPKKMVSELEHLASDYEGKELRESVGEYEAHLIRKALIRNDSNRTQTAKELGIHRSLLYKKMEKYNIRDC